MARKANQTRRIRSKRRGHRGFASRIVGLTIKRFGACYNLGQFTVVVDKLVVDVFVQRGPSGQNLVDPLGMFRTMFHWSKFQNHLGWNLDNSLENVVVTTSDDQSNCGY